MFIYTVEEAVEKSDIDFIIQHLQKSSTSHENAEIEKILVLIVQSNKMLTENKSIILEKMRVLRIDIPDEVLSSLITIAKKRKEVPVLDYLLSIRRYAPENTTC